MCPQCASTNSYIAMAQGGKGVVTPGCPACRKRIFTMSKFVDHLADDVLPPLLDKLSTGRDNQANVAQDSADQSAADSGSV